MQGVVDACGVSRVERAVYPTQRVADLLPVGGEASRHDGECEGDHAVAPQRRGVVVGVVACGVEYGVEEGACGVVADGVDGLVVVGGPQVQAEGHGAVAAVLCVAVEAGVDVRLAGNEAYCGVEPRVGEVRRADGVAVVAVVGGVHADGMPQGIAAAVGVDGEARQGGVGRGEACQYHVVAVYRRRPSEGAVQPSVGGGVEYPQGVCAVVAAAVVAAVDGGGGVGALHVDGAPQGVYALVVGDACYEGDEHVAGVGEVHAGSRRRALGAVGQQPAEGLHGLAGTQRRHAVAADGAAVGQLQVELAVFNRERCVEER